MAIKNEKKPGNQATNQNSLNQNPMNMGGPSLNAAIPANTDKDADTDPDMDKNQEPAHMSSQAADPGEFKASALESRRSLKDGRDD